MNEEREGSSYDEWSLVTKKNICISLIEELLEMKETTDTASVVSYLDLHLEIDNESRFRTKFSIYM
jgi:hypothetical protein